MISCSMDMCYRDNNVVVDTNVGYNEYSIWFWARSLIDILKIVEMSSSASVSLYFTMLKEKQLEKVSTRWKPEKSSLFIIVPMQVSYHYFKYKDTTICRIIGNNIVMT